jgi:hypothetical protein
MTILTILLMPFMFLVVLRQEQSRYYKRLKAFHDWEMKNIQVMYSDTWCQLTLATLKEQ